MSTISISSLFPFRRLKFVNSEEVELGIGSGKVIEFRPDQRFSPICAHCKTKGTSQHSKHQRFLRDLSLGPHKTLIHLNYRKIYCPHCG